MLLTPDEEKVLLAVKAHMHHAYFLMRTASHQWREARHLLHRVFESLNELEQKATGLRSSFQEPDA
jgi:hypothetical protein